MDMEVTTNLSVRTPPPHYLAELRMEPSTSSVAFSAPCDACGCRKRRCLLPAFAPRKKMLLELSPFSSPPPPQSLVQAPLARTSSSAGSGGVLSSALLASPEQALARTNSSAGDGAVWPFAFSISPAGRAHVGLTRRISSSSSGVVLPPALLASPEPALARKNSGAGDSVGLPSALLASPEPALARKNSGAGHSAVSPYALSTSPVPVELARTSSGGGDGISPLFVFSASPASAPPARSRSGGGDARSRRLLCAERCRSELQLRAQQQDAPVVTKDVFAYGEAAPSSSPSKLPAKSCCTFFTSPAKSCSMEKTSNKEASVAVVVGPTAQLACCGPEVAVRVTCTCGAEKAFCFCFNHRH